MKSPGRLILKETDRFQLHDHKDCFQPRLILKSKPLPGITYHLLQKSCRGWWTASDYHASFFLPINWEDLSLRTRIKHVITKSLNRIGGEIIALNIEIHEPKSKHLDLAHVHQNYKLHIQPAVSGLQCPLLIIHLLSNANIQYWIRLPYSQRLSRFSTQTDQNNVMHNKSENIVHTFGNTWLWIIISSYVQQNFHRIHNIF